MVELINDDCMKVMKTFKNNHFDLAIVDPPYGIEMDGGKIGGDKLGKAKNYTQKDWDKKTPSKEYFDELRRISKNQIVWGGNYFVENLTNSPCWVVWDKDNSGNFADCELAWTSFKTAVRNFKYRWNGMIQQNMKNKEVRIHPTQKPKALYEWLLMNYAKNGDKILDTHLGSGSIAIACHDLGYDLTGIELDKEYYDAAVKRYNQHKSQLQIW